MVLDKYTAKKTAELLLQIKAIKLNPKNPFKWASGWNSPIYCDNRIILSHPEIRVFVREQMVKQIEKIFEVDKPIIGMIHVKALPGTPNNRLNISKIIDCNYLL